MLCGAGTPTSGGGLSQRTSAPLEWRRACGPGTLIPLCRCLCLLRLIQFLTFVTWLLPPSCQLQILGLVRMIAPLRYEDLYSSILKPLNKLFFSSTVGFKVAPLRLASSCLSRMA